MIKQYIMESVYGPMSKYNPVIQIHLISPAPRAPIEKNGNNIRNAASTCIDRADSMSLDRMDNSPMIIPVTISRFGILLLFISVYTDISKSTHRITTIRVTSLSSCIASITDIPPDCPHKITECAKIQPEITKWYSIVSHTKE